MAETTVIHTITPIDISLETLVNHIRKAHVQHDFERRNHLIELVLQRTQASNERWANCILRHSNASPGERSTLARDLYAELCESMLRALLDPSRHFWEKNFWHSLTFERKHVYCAFMRREGRWQSPHIRRSARVPQSLMMSLDRQKSNETFDEVPLILSLEDEQAEAQLSRVENSDLLPLVLTLPTGLKSVILLLFWEGRSEREVAQILGISDRSVRYRRQQALKMLRSALA